jgi:t-SNARE complex subunit (syntaxin)
MTEQVETQTLVTPGGDYAYDQARSDDIRQICQGVKGLNDVVIDLQMLVLTQGEQIEWIDNELVEVERDVKEGAGEIDRAKNTVPCCERVKRYLIVVLVILIVICVVLLVIKFAVLGGK